MTDITPPSSHSGTPVRGLGHLQKSSPGSSHLPMPDNSHFEDQVVGGSSSLSPEQDMEELVDTDGSEDEEMDQDGVEVVEEDVNVGAETTGLDSPLAPAPGTAASGSKAGKAHSTPSKRSLKPSASTKNVKGKKKDTDLFENDIVSRWNREIGDVCAQPTKA